MSKRKTRKQKIKSQQRRLEDQQRLKELRDLKEQLELKIRLDQKKAVKGFHIRNLQIFKDTCNFIAPYVICAGLTVGVFSFFDGGLPIKRDDINRYKYSNLSIEAEGEYSSLTEEYIYHGTLSDSIPSSTIKIYSPWQEENGNYIRYKREYDISSNEKEIIESVLKKDYEGLFNSLSEYKEEVEVANYNIEDNKFIIEGEIHLLDKEDKITYPESQKKNIIITIIEAIIALSLGSLIAWKRKFSYLEAIEDDNNSYRFKVEVYKNELKELEETNNKILILERGGRIK